MQLYCTEFIFDGISSKEYDLIICSFDGTKNGEMTAGSKIEFTTFKAPNSNRWVKTGSSYTEQLTFNFQICKYKCDKSNVEPISERELAFLMRWLVRKEYKDLQFIQEGYENIFYHCQINAQKYEVAGECVGLSLTVVCDAPFGWSELMTYDATVTGSSSFSLYDSSDEIGVVYPDIQIVSNKNQAISIENKTTNMKTSIKNCQANEQIVLSNETAKSSMCVLVENAMEYSGQHSTFYDDFNWDWFSIGNTFNNRVNEIIITGDCSMHFEWRVPRKAVV